MEQISNSEIGQNIHRNISNVMGDLGEQSTMRHLQNVRAQCEKAQKTKHKKNTPAEIKSENHAHYFLRFGFSISGLFHKTRLLMEIIGC